MSNDGYWSQQDQQGTQQMPFAQQSQQHQQTQQFQQPQYAPPKQFVQPPQATSMGGWVLNLFLAAIPVVGLVLLFVWAFGATPDESKKNWARANLIWILIAIAVYAVIFFAIGGISFTNLYNIG